MKAAIVLGILFLCTLARAEQVPTEMWSVEGHNFTSKAAAIRYIVNSGKRLNVIHTQCEILTNKLAFKKCPKNKESNFDNEQFAGLKVNAK